MPDFIEVCEDAARRAGTVLLENIGKVGYREKGPADLVTAADEAAQEAVRRTIHQAFPDHGLIGEEDKPGQRASLDQFEYCWIVDPLDGTTNFVHQVPHFSVSLALAHRGTLAAAVVYDPMSRECFTAVRGGGAFLNGSRIHTSPIGQLSRALVAVGFPSVVTPDCPDLKAFNEAVKVCQSMRRTGSAALNLAYVACGRFDAAWSFVCKVWDIAAGTLLVQEAGGVITRMNGQPLPLENGPFLAAANGLLHAETLAMVARAAPTVGV